MKRTVAIYVPLDHIYGQRVFEGVLHYSRQAGDWTFVDLYKLERSAAKVAASASVNGVIGHFRSPRDARPFAALGVPIVNVSNLSEKMDLARVGLDDTRVGAVAAEHLVERGYRRFAVVSNPNIPYSAERARGFRDFLSGRDLAVADLNWSALPRSTLGRRARILRWLRGLRGPCGAFEACWTASWLREGARALGLRIPEDLGFVGTGEDPHGCEIQTPPLTSVDMPIERVGLEAASLLDSLMRGRAAPKGPVLVEPPGVSGRASTGVFVTSDPDVAAVLEFMRRNVRAGVGVEAVASTVNLSRRSLERRFREAVGRSPAEEMRLIRFEKACVLLRDTSLPLKAVARQAGFPRAERLWEQTRIRLGLTPRQYRQRNRL